MTAAMHEEWRPSPAESPGTDVAPPRRRLPGWVLLCLFPVSVLLTVFAIGGADGRTPAGVRVEVRVPSGDLTEAGAVADRLADAGIDVVRVLPIDSGPGGDQFIRRMEIRYDRDSEQALVRANAVRRALGTGTIVRSSGAASGADVTLIIGKDVQSE